MPYGTDNHDTLEVIDPNEWENTVAIQSLLKSEGGITNGSTQSSKPSETEMPCDVGQASSVPDAQVDDPSGCPSLSSKPMAVEKDLEPSSGSPGVATEAAPTNGLSNHEGDMDVPDQTNLVASSSKPMVGGLDDGDVVTTADDGNVSDAPSEVGGQPTKSKHASYFSIWQVSVMQQTLIFLHN